ncbi:MAG: PQQ-like beta-propeller repeat protein [Candidatus Hydrogenedentes bacterium]|nr:PQQ-like beta-propeller repeat protein [Candidatus Hydrogenedentota bacterium]
MAENESESKKPESESEATQPAAAAEAADGAAEEAPESLEAQAPPEPAGPPPEPRPGIVVPLLIIAVQHALAWSIASTSTTPHQTYIGIAAVPLIGALLLLAWWLRSRTVPKRERFIGAGLALGAVVLPVLLSRPFAPMLLVYTLPTLATGLAVVLLATAGMRWDVRRKVLLGAMAVCAVFYCLVKVAGVDGNMAPLLSARWSTAPEAGLASGTAVENQVAALPEDLDPEDWPGFRGDRRDGRNRVSTFGVDWAANPPVELWRRPIGLGWSSFTVIGDYCFTQEQRGEDEVVVCYDANTGEEVWINAVQERFSEVMGDGPRATPEYRNGKLFTQGATGILQCIDAATGETIWRRDLKEDAGIGIPRWGFSSSPLAHGELVIAYNGAGDGKSLIAYNQADGAIVWTAGKGHNGYSSPHFGEVAATPHIFMNSNYGIEAFDPATGALLWEQEWDLKNNPRVAQPFVLDLYNIYAGTGQRKGIRMIKVWKEGDALVPRTNYTSERFRPYFNDYVHHDGYLYGFDGTRFACMETTDGSVRFTGERWGGQVLLLNEMDMLIVLTEAGEVVLVAAYPSFVDIRGRFQALSSKTWNHPVVAHGKLFVRNDREAVCYALPRAPGPDPAETEAEAGGAEDEPAE